MMSPLDKELERMMLKDDVKSLKEKLAKLKIEASQQKSRIKRLQALANYILAAMSDEDYDSDPMIDRAFNKCDKAGDLDE